MIPRPSRVSRRALLGGAVATGAALAIGSGRTAALGSAPVPPVARREPFPFALPGGLDIDPYRWLEHPDDPEVIAYLEAENAYAAAVMAPTKALEEELYAELRRRIDFDDVAVPGLWYGYEYYTRSEEGLDYDLLCRRKQAPGAPEEILVDPNRIDAPFVALGAWQATLDNRFFAYGLDTSGAEFYTLTVLDTATGETLVEIPNTAGLEWAPDNRTLFYSLQDETGRSYQIRRHRLGDDPAADPILFQEDDPAFAVGVSATKDRRYLLAYSAQFDTTKVLMLPADDLDGAFRPVVPPTPGVRAFLEHRNGRFLLMTDRDAPNFMLLSAPAGPEAPERWDVLVPHREDRLLDGFDPFDRHLVLYGRTGGYTTLWTVDDESGELAEIRFDEAAYFVTPGANWMPDSDKLRLRYTSMVTPLTDYEVDLVTGEKSVLKVQPVPGGYDPSRYVTERLYATAPDGARVPISLVSRRDGFDRPKPLRLDGYGGYGISQEPRFGALRLSLLDRGFTLAIAHIRGGSELGRRWWDEGRRLEKTNGFTDFIACAEHLVAEGYTTPAQLSALGGSNGGLLMGAVANRRPDLFRAMVAQVPVADVIAFLLRAPIGPGNTNELGDPRDPIFHDYQWSYSPYQNLRPTTYPALLVTGGLEDTRVPYWLPAKWVARLRATAVADPGRPILLRTEMAGGHFGASGLTDATRETAIMYAFLLTQLGVVDVAVGRAAPPVAAVGEPSSRSRVRVARAWRGSAAADAGVESAASASPPPGDLPPG